MYSIPFIQYLRPAGMRREITLYTMKPDVGELAERFIKGGGHFTCEVLTTGEVAFYAGIEVKGEVWETAIIISKNVPAKIQKAIEQVVRDAMELATAQKLLKDMPPT